MQKEIGIAIDIGTTTVALCAVDLSTGGRIKTISSINAQAEHGADVTSRIMHSIENGHRTLTKLIQDQVDAMIYKALHQVEATNLPRKISSKKEQVNHFAISCGNVKKIVIAANTVMQHLAAGYPPASLGTAPFEPVSYFGEELPYWGIAEKNHGLSNKETSEDMCRINTTCINSPAVYYTPCISAYVGGDITAGILAAGFEDFHDTVLFIDIGTNSEITLKHKGTYYCCAAAAGPAFERLKSINLRGSDLIDLLAEMLDTGEIDQTGRLITGKEGRISAADIRQLQLAKAAVAGGIRVLMHYAGISEQNISLLALAGAFGSHINTKSAVRIGLFPKTLLPVAKAYGNTALDGAVLALRSEDARARLIKIRSKCQYIELSSNAFFNDMFVEEMSFRG